MSEAHGVTTERDVNVLARAAGVSVPAAEAAAVAARLTELRTAVMKAGARVPPAAAPAVIFDARWED
jgi:hypothetical protein